MKLGQLEVIEDTTFSTKLLERSSQGTRFLDSEFLNIFDAS